MKVLQTRCAPNQVNLSRSKHKYSPDLLHLHTNQVKELTMKQIIFFALTIFIYIGAFEVAKNMVGDGETAVFVGVACGGICFWWMVSKIKD